MYEEFFGLQRRPFSPTPDANCFVPLDAHQSALDALAVSCERGQGIGVLTGEAGLGKSLVGLRLAFELQPTFATAFLRHSAYATRRALLQAILFELNLPYERKADQELRLDLTAALQSMRAEKQAFALIVDEAHRLSLPLLDELRLLTLLSEGGDSLVRLVLIGNRDLEERLADPELTAFNQRVCCQVDLVPLTQLESLEYLRSSLEFAGGHAEELFTEEALIFLAKAADGIPRCLNHLADHSLLLAYVAERRPISADIVQNALADLKRLPLQWNDPISGGEIYRGHSSNPQLEDSAVDLWPVRESKPENSTQQTTSWNDELFRQPSAAIEIGGDSEQSNMGVETAPVSTEEITCLKQNWQEVTRDSSSIPIEFDEAIEIEHTREPAEAPCSLGQIFAAHELEFGSPSPHTFIVEEFVSQEKSVEAASAPRDNELQNEAQSTDREFHSDDEQDPAWSLPNTARSTDDAEIEFDEEPVVDRYVRIETGGINERSIRPKRTAQQPQAITRRSITVAKTTPLIVNEAPIPVELRDSSPAEAEATKLGSDESGIVESYSRSSRESFHQPSEPRFEETLPSADASDDSLFGGSSNNNAQDDDDNRDWHLPSELLRATLEDDGIEQQIGADVLDLYLDVQQSMLEKGMASELPSISLDKPDSEEPPRAVEKPNPALSAKTFDLDETIERAAIPPASQPGAIQRAYGRLFSELRRRKP